MIEDLRSHPDGAHLESDVCIIGAGAAGIAIAREFLHTRSTVVVLESGGTEREATDDLLNEGESVGLPFEGLAAGRARAFGGTTTLWPGQCIRLDDIDFQARDWVPHSGWPLTRRALTPFYQRAEALMGLPARDFDEQAWQRVGVRPPDFDASLLQHRTSAYSPHPDLGRRYREELRRAGNVRVLLHAIATGVEVWPTGASGGWVRARTPEGRSARVSARAIVLCGGGVENARLLLLSNLGNEHDLVGRFFQDHPTVWRDLRVDRPEVLQGFYGRLGRGRTKYLPKIRLSAEQQRSRRILNCVADVVCETTDSPGTATAKILSRSLQERRRPEGLGRAEIRQMVRELDGVAVGAFRRFVQGRIAAEPLACARLKILVEQAPNPSSRIGLADEVDELGVRKVRVDWRLTQLEQDTVDVMVKTLDAELRRLGIAAVTDPDAGGVNPTSGFGDAYHHMGTTRMSTDPTTGVVDLDCQVHGVPGVYICGSSVFPTSGYANPTSTVVALALRLADHLAAAAPPG